MSGDLDELHRAFGRVEGLLEGNTSILHGIREDLGVITEGVNKVEKKVWWFSGVGAACAFLAAKITGKI